MKRTWILVMLFSNITFQVMNSSEEIINNSTPFIKTGPLVGVNSNKKRISLNFESPSEVYPDFFTYLFDRIDALINDLYSLDDQSYIEKCQSYQVLDKSFFNNQLSNHPELKMGEIKNSDNNNILQALWLVSFGLYISVKHYFNQDLDEKDLKEVRSALLDKYYIFVQHYLVPMTRYFLEKMDFVLESGDYKDLILYELEDMGLEGNSLIDLLIEYEVKEKKYLLFKCENLFLSSIQTLMKSFYQDRRSYQNICKKLCETNKDVLNNLARNSYIDLSHVKNNDGSDLLALFLIQALQIKYLFDQGSMDREKYDIFKDEYLLPMVKYLLENISILRKDRLNQEPIVYLKEFDITNDEIKKELKNIKQKLDVADNHPVKKGSDNLTKILNSQDIEWQYLLSALMSITLFSGVLSDDSINQVNAILQTVFFNLGKYNSNIKSSDIPYVKLFVNMLFDKVKKDLDTDPLMKTPQNKGRLAALLRIAALCGNNDIIKLAIQNGANVNEESKLGGGTVLGEAVRSRNIDSVNLLLRNGASLDVGTTITRLHRLLDLAISNNDVDMVKLLESKGLLESQGLINIFDQLQSSFMNALTYKAVDVIKYLATKKIDIKAESEVGYSPLSYFLYTCDINNEDPNLINPTTKEIIDLLLEKGADINRIDSSLEGTPLIVAVRKNSLPLIEYLLEKGADPRIRNRIGKTAYDEIEYIIASNGGLTPERIREFRDIQALLNKYAKRYKAD